MSFEASISTKMSKSISAVKPNLPAATTRIISQKPTLPSTGVPIVDRVREMILEKGGRAGFRAIIRILRIMDDNGNRQLDPQEFEDGLNAYGLSPTKQEMQQIMEYFDRDRSGQISVTEFTRAVRGPMNTARASLVWQVYDQLDENSDQVVTFDDVKMAYDVKQHPEVLSGEKTSQEVLMEFMKGWDKNGDGTITREEFMEYYEDVGAGIDSDQYFELMIRNAWHLWDDPSANKLNCKRALVLHSDGTQTIQPIKNDAGIGPKDTRKIIERLQRQGVPNIKSVYMM
eukprot:NODE_3397_length_975_cov_63.614387_g3250_i0.p1 GENE.NODE_3397_length_975_cov_63.614387_g3250_i0~~NODE_3397_length_975_cov_63.614387_g3250_i0.p1  ORF type:complete len:313 (-),score=92.93 NODE_3397_length_975_cov_63.614387_g3250_i0:36-893(-)